MNKFIPTSVVLITEEELILLSNLHDNVTGFGPCFYIAACDLHRKIGQHFEDVSRPLSFLSEHGLVCIDAKTPEEEILAWEYYRLEKEKLVKSGVFNSREVAAWGPPFVANCESPRIYVTGVGANYVRILRQTLITKLKEEDSNKPINPNKKPTKCGLKEMPNEKNAGGFLKNLLTTSWQEFVVKVASEILCSFIR